jgi:hypothetical protein
LEPTLTAAERENYILGLLRSNKQCDLPCWWGIIPGSTSWAETEKFILHLGAKTSVFPTSGEFIWHATGGFDLLDRGVHNDVTFFESQGIVAAIEIHTGGEANPKEFQADWGNFSPEQLITVYGRPSRVWLQSYSSADGGTPTSVPYSLWIFYDKLGFLIRYSGAVRYKSIYRICPALNDEGGGVTIDLYLRSSSDPMPLEKLVELMGADRPYTLPLESATTLTLDEFYNLFLQKDKIACIETPRDIWP